MAPATTTKTAMRFATNVAGTACARHAKEKDGYRMTNKIEAGYDVSDGYAGGRRPQSFRIDPEDFRDLNDEEIVRALNAQMEEDFAQKVCPCLADETGLVQQIKDVLAASPDSDD